jgi:antagonist of KipI
MMVSAEQTEVFEVLDPGALTTVQDLGRFGYSRFGVPPSGALDPLSMRIANLLAGNDEGDACLETTARGLKLKALRDAAIAITGGDLSPTLNGKPLEMWRSHFVGAGDVLAFTRLRRGCRAYLAITGGIAVPEIMGSKSTCLSGKFGGLKGRAIRRADKLSAGPAALDPGRLGLAFPKEWVPVFESEVRLRVIPGPQYDHFTGTGGKVFFSSLYRVSPRLDRVGIRLEGPPIERRPEVEDSIISEGLLPGAVQVPGDGMPIIILTELVTGGYAKIAGVVSVDLPKVGQAKPGDRVGFESISIEEAHVLLKAQEERLRVFKSFLS